MKRMAEIIKKKRSLSPHPNPKKGNYGKKMIISRNSQCKTINKLLLKLKKNSFRNMSLKLYHMLPKYVEALNAIC